MGRPRLNPKRWITAISIVAILVLSASPGSAAEGDAGIRVYPTSGLVTDENGGTASFYLVLSSRPETPVEIPLTSSNPAEGVLQTALVKFTPGTWDQPKPVMIRGVADRVPDGDTPYTILTGRARSKDRSYQGLDAQDVTVVNINDAFPSAQDDLAQTLEDTPVEIDVLGNDTSLDDEPITISIDSPPQQGSAQVEDSNMIVYSPQANSNGEDNFKYAVCDSDGDCAQAIVRVTITPVDDDVTALDDEAVTTVNTPVVIDVLANDSAGDDDEEGVLFLVQFDETSQEGGTVIRQDGGTPGDLRDDQLEYRPPDGFTGEDSFEYTASNGNEEDEATVTIDVKTGNGAPVADDDSFATGQKTVLTIATPGVLGNDTDPDGDALQTVLVDPPNHAALILNPNGSFTFTPNGTYVGIDKFIYKASDGANQSNQATVSIDIKDQVLPLVNWVSPVKNGEVYDVTSGTVRLVIEASDNVGVARVRFYRWDALAGEYVEIAEDRTAPFQFDLAVESLNVAWNQVFVRSYDAAGNPSAQKFIWLYLTGRAIYLPTISR